MNVGFKVHGVARTTITRTAKVDGEDMSVAVQALEVELVTEADHSGSLTLRFFGQEIAAAEVMFQPDATVSASLATTAKTQD